MSGMLDGWEKHLPPEALAEMTAELAAASDDERPTVIAAWKSTAQIHADPELHARLTASTDGDHGPAPDPRAV